MDKKYIVTSRYQHWTSNGEIEFTKWFVLNSIPRTKKEAEEFIAETKKNFANIDKVTKLNHEFELKSYDEYLQEHEDQKKKIEELVERRNEYYKSDAYKELLKKKRKAAKELKEHQKKFAAEHPEMFL